MRDAVNIQAVQLVADGLKDLHDHVVFVGGSVISLYVNDPGADLPRPTSDIDLVSVVSTYAEYERLEVRSRELGFHHSPEDNIMCRYSYHGVMVDIMPTDVPAIGPTNKWNEVVDPTSSECKDGSWAAPWNNDQNNWDNEKQNMLLHCHYLASFDRSNSSTKCPPSTYLPMFSAWPRSVHPASHWRRML